MTETPLLILWRKVDAILVAAGARVATFGELRSFEPYHQPALRIAYLIWNDRRS